uniref:50 kDa hatching enzyme n=1 Tax=Magallana gigas TaxID=29159 RepID=K1R2Q8_MAGGI
MHMILTNYGNKKWKDLCSFGRDLYAFWRIGKLLSPDLTTMIALTRMLVHSLSVAIKRSIMVTEVAEARKALRTWSRYSNLRFKYTRKRPDIRILFARYEHGDGDYNAFDGQGRTIGHAFRPKNGGTHFDDDELWSVSTNLSTGEIHLPTAALHEIGHAIGLEHVSDYSSVMSAYFTTPKARPSALDIAQLRDLYSEYYRKS